MSEVNTAAGMFPSYIGMKAALQQLQRQNLQLEQLSIAGRANGRDALIGSLAERRIELDSPLCGTFWVTGPLADSILASMREPACTCGGHGSSELATGLCRAGVPDHRAREYEEALAQGQSILMAHGSFDEIARAVEVLSDSARAVRLHVDCRWDA